MYRSVLFTLTTHIQSFAMICKPAGHYSNWQLK